MAVEEPAFLSTYDPDALHFYVTAALPETLDTEACPEPVEGLSWEDFGAKQSSPERSRRKRAGGDTFATLSACLGKPSKRARDLGFMLSFAYKRFDGKLPEPGALDDEDRAALRRCSGQAWARRWPACLQLRSNCQADA